MNIWWGISKNFWGHTFWGPAKLKGHLKFWKNKVLFWLISEITRLIKQVNLADKVERDHSLPTRSCSCMKRSNTSDFTERFLLVFTGHYFCVFIANTTSFEVVLGLSLPPFPPFRWHHTDLRFWVAKVVVRMKKHSLFVSAHNLLHAAEIQFSSVMLAI